MDTLQSHEATGKRPRLHSYYIEHTFMCSCEVITYAIYSKYLLKRVAMQFQMHPLHSQVYYMFSL